MIIKKDFRLEKEKKSQWIYKISLNKKADAYLEASWEDNTVDPSIPFDPKSSWEPELNIENAVANMKQEVTYRVEQVNGKMKVYECRTIKATFWERLELWDFPLGKFFIANNKIFFVKY